MHTHVPSTAVRATGAHQRVETGRADKPNGNIRPKLQASMRSQRVERRTPPHPTQPNSTPSSSRVSRNNRRGNRRDRKRGGETDQPQPPTRSVYKALSWRLVRPYGEKNFARNKKHTQTSFFSPRIIISEGIIYWQNHASPKQIIPL